jgi:hypothetical protein
MPQADAIDLPYEGVAGARIGDEMLFVVHVFRVGSRRQRQVLVMHCIHILKSATPGRR